jgi:hypothetical protein
VKNKNMFIWKTGSLPFDKGQQDFGHRKEGIQRALHKELLHKTRYLTRSHHNLYSAKPVQIWYQISNLQEVILGYFLIKCFYLRSNVIWAAARCMQ